MWQGCPHGGKARESEMASDQAVSSRPVTAIDRFSWRLNNMLRGFDTLPLRVTAA
jgi:hypothetical protein